MSEKPEGLQNFVLSYWQGRQPLWKAFWLINAPASYASDCNPGFHFIASGLRLLHEMGKKKGAEAPIFNTANKSNSDLGWFLTSSHSTN